MKRALILIAMLIAALAILVACSKNDGRSGETSAVKNEGVSEETQGSQGVTPSATSSVASTAASEATETVTTDDGVSTEFEESVEHTLVEIPIEEE